VESFDFDAFSMSASVGRNQAFTLGVFKMMTSLS